MDRSQPVLQCDDCVTTFNSQMQMTQHLTSSKHIKKVQKKQITHVQFRGQERGRGRGRGRARGGNIKRPRSNNLITVLVASPLCSIDYWKSVSLICSLIIFYLTNRFHVAVRLFSNRSQMTSKCGKNKKVAHEAIAECVTDVLTTF